ncbi:zinc finger protein CONSTANS-LIKE 12 [Quercus suber]|uniref:B-box domain protein 31 n=1 Tax=Quercus suber TaxID=58331 RepID=A0AAW0L501_QUESU
MKTCELCKIQARTYCESDQASLCWDCDAKVHGANFLVARHSRTLLCNTCQSQTPWKASGAKLGHTFSVCETCVRGNHNNEEEEEELEDDDHVHGDESPSPTMSSSSSNEEESVTVTVFSSLKLKRMHENASDLLYSMDDLGRASSPREATCIDSCRPLKDRRIEPGRLAQVHSRSASSLAIMESPKRLHQRDLCEPRKESGTVNLDSFSSL